MTNVCTFSRRVTAFAVSHRKYCVCMDGVMELYVRKFTFTRNVDTLILLVLWYPDQIPIVCIHKVMELYVH